MLETAASKPSFQTKGAIETGPLIHPACVMYQSPFPSRTTSEACELILPTFTSNSHERIVRKINIRPVVITHEQVVVLCTSDNERRLCRTAKGTSLRMYKRHLAVTPMNQVLARHACNDMVPAFRPACCRVVQDPTVLQRHHHRIPA